MALALMIITVILAGLLGAVGRRWAGGLFSHWFKFDPGEQLLRLLWSLMITAPLFIILPWANWWHIAGYALTVLIGSLMGFGRNGMDPVNFSDCIGTLQNSALGAVLTAGWAWYLGDAWWIALPSMLFGPLAYWAAHRWPISWPTFEANVANANHPDDTPPMAELYWGFARGVTLALTAVILLH